MTSSSSSIDPSINALKAVFDANGSHPNSTRTQAVIKSLKLQEHPEGGYFVETDRDNSRVPNPFPNQPNGTPKPTGDLSAGSRSASTTIFYYLTPERPLGVLHRNKPRCIHTLHRGRGRYVVIHAGEAASESHPNGYGGSEDGSDEASRWNSKARIASFVVGPNVDKGERLQWIVEGGTYKGSFLLPDVEGGTESDGLLISETVVPGFEWGDHDYMKAKRLEALVTEGQRRELEWMLRKDRA